MNKEAAEILANALEKDAVDHESERYSEIGEHWDDVYAELLPIEDIDQQIYGLALKFWDDWCDASNHEWQYHKPIEKDDWPVFAREIAQSLRSGNLPNNNVIIEQFLPKPKVSIIAKIKALFSS